ncbi:hypothetical protein ACO0LD_30660 [Undibacterium sp. Ji83W]|uniref:hypothetical protein n=1 Tax=Undibacterium sp. Ji83W TaxID=3413043 RepID=UPI003BF44C83
MNVTFDMSQLNNPALTASNVFISFAAAASDMVYGSGTSAQTINFVNGNLTVGGQSYGTSPAYSLQDIATNGLVLNSATSLIGFISYGTATGIAQLATGTQPNLLSAATPRYSIFEVSYDGTTGGADITNISQYGGSIELAFLQDGTTQTYVGNTLDTTSTFNALAAVSGFSGSTSTTAVFLDNDGLFLRAIGTNLFPDGTVQNPYPGFNAYLQNLFTSYGSKSVVTELTNLAPGQNPGGAGSAGFLSTSVATQVTPSTSYNLDYHFTATVSQVTVPSGASDPNGTYSVQLSGYVNATPSTGGSTVIYNNLSVSIAADDLVGGNLYMTNFIYQAATTGAGISVTQSGWDALNNDFGTANVNAAALLKATGDFAEGMTCGFIGSSTLSTTSPPTALSGLSSYEWWQNPTLAYAPAQPNNNYYSVYGNVISANSGGQNGITFSRGGVYGSPYDDRFGLNLIAPNASTDEMHITLLADGNLTPTSPT